MNLKVNKLSSTKTQLPYEYYSVPYCRPDPIVNSAENLGEVLRGDRIENSLYQVCRSALPPPSGLRGPVDLLGLHDPLQLEMRLDEQCKVVCKIDSLTKDQAKAFRSKVEDEYRVNM